VKKFKPRFSLQQWLHWSLSLCLAGFVVACGSGDRFVNPTALNSHYNDEQPALSGNGRFVAFVSNRSGSRQILLYDLQQQNLMPLPNLNRPDTIAESPSLSYTGRYIAYIVGDQGRPTVALYDRATQRSQLLTQSYPSWVRHPSISPDGRYIVFESSTRGQWDIEVLDRGPNIELDIPDSVPPGSAATLSP